MKEFYDFILKIFTPLPLCVFVLILFSSLQAQTLAPDGPGNDAQWATAGKQGVGTSASLESKVWFTLAQGVMTEVYYPDVTVANVHLLQFVVVNPKTGKIETEQLDSNHKIESLRTGASKNISPISNLSIYKNYYTPSSLSFKQTNWSKTGDWSIEKIYVTNPKNNSVVISVKFGSGNPDNQLYIYYDASLGNSGMGDTAWSKGNAFLSSDQAKASAIACHYCKFEELTNGFLGTPSDGLAQLKKDGRILNSFDRAENGNVVQMARIKPVFSRGYNFEISLGFGTTADEALKTAQDSLVKGFEKVYQEYQEGWISYLKTLPKVEPKYQAQFNLAAMLLKAHEDKTHPGANIASLTIPWGGDKNANENTVGGYHLVWSRDLYQVATAFMALGDKAAAERALEFLFKVQQKPDGSFPQNSWLDGKPFWNSLQMDEVAFPLILAYQLQHFDKATYENHIKNAADFIVKNGPVTPQERWEERSGYSPSTIAAEIAGLICAAEIARRNGDEPRATIYTAAADDWARNIDRWTVTTNGKYRDGNYYLRLTQKGNPNAGDKLDLGNGAGFFDEREIIDAGFLELVRLGIKSPDDPLIQKSLKVVDEVIRVNTPNGDAFYRYNHDGYGEMDDGRRWNFDGKYTGRGRLWALLSGERGQYELALKSKHDSPKSKVENPQSAIPDPKFRLDAMLGFASEGLMIPEQIWDRKETPKNIDKQFVPELEFGEGTGSATPLAWSMAQFIRLAVNLKVGKNLDTPDIVYDRYVKNAVPGQTSNFGGTDEEIVLPVKSGEKFSFSRPAPKGTKIGYIFGGKANFIEVGDEAKFSVEVIAPETVEIVVVGIQTPDGSTAFERVKVRSADKTEPQKFSADTIEKLKNAKQSPLIENGKAILFYRGEAKNVMVAGDLTNWNPGRIFMQKIAENLFAVGLDLSSTARAEYKFIVDGKWIADDLSQNKIDNGVGGENSFFVMPEYKATAWDKGETPKLETIEIESKIYGKRKVQVYVPKSEPSSVADGLTRESENTNKTSNPSNSKLQPPASADGSDLPTFYFQDGSDYINRAKAIQIHQNLVKADKIKPFIMVFIDPKDRMKEYWANDDYAKFVATEVVPAIDAKYNTIKTRDGRGVFGASLGGITGVWVGLKYPEIFSRIGGQSSSFWVDNERVVKELAKLDANQIKYKFYLDDGMLEGAEDTRRVNVLLRGRGFAVTYIEGETGHNWTSWRDRLENAFVALMN